MGQGILISKSDPERYFDEGTARRLGEKTLRRSLAALRVDRDDDGEQITVHFGSGTAFWQASLLRDDNDALVILDGELYYDDPYSARDARAAFETLRDLAEALHARLWVEGGDCPEVLDPDALAEAIRDAQERATLPDPPLSGQQKPTPTKTPGFIRNASTWDEADEHFTTFIAAVPQRRLQLAERVAASRGPALDHSVESLLPVTDWFITTALEAAEPPPVDYWPAWAEPPSPDFVPSQELPGTPGWLALLWEQVGVYIGDVMLAQVPGSRWVCWRDKHPRAAHNGLPVIDIGVPVRGFDAMGCANAGVIRALSDRGRGGGWPDRGQPLEHFRGTLAQREEYLRENAPRWQAAPTGPKAKRTQATPGG